MKIKEFNMSINSRKNHAAKKRKEKKIQRRLNPFAEFLKTKEECINIIMSFHKIKDYLVRVDKQLLEHKVTKEINGETVSVLFEYKEEVVNIFNAAIKPGYDIIDKAHYSPNDMSNIENLIDLFSKLTGAYMKLSELTEKYKDDILAHDNFMAEQRKKQEEEMKASLVKSMENVSETDGVLKIEDPQLIKVDNSEEVLDNIETSIEASTEEDMCSS